MHKLLALAAQRKTLFFKEDRALRALLAVSLAGFFIAIAQPTWRSGAVSVSKEGAAHHDECRYRDVGADAPNYGNRLRRQNENRGDQRRDTEEFPQMTCLAA